jgi:hypothetical protein
MKNVQKKQKNDGLYNGISKVQVLRIFWIHKFEFISDFDIRVSDLVPALPG